MIRTLIAILLLCLITGCKARKQTSDLLTVSGSSFTENDPSLYVLDERGFDGHGINTLVVRRLECGGEERYLRGTIEELTTTCHEITAVNLNELLQLHYLPYFYDASGIDRLTPQQQEFLVYLIFSLRPFPTRNSPLVLNIPAIRKEKFDLGKVDSIYSEMFLKHLAKLADFLPYNLSNIKTLTKITTPQTLNVSALPQGWNEQILKVTPGLLNSTSLVSLSAKGQSICAVTLNSIRFADNLGAWTTIPFRGSNVDADGYYRQFRLTRPNATSEWTYVRILWRSLADTSSTCEVKLNGSGSVVPEEPTPVQPPSGTAEPSRPEKFRQLTNRFGSVGHRLHHMLWHALRNGWNRPGTTDRDRQLMTQVVPEQNWTPPRPVIYGANGSVDIRLTEQQSPGAGEDFFHMHREMTEIAQKILGKDFVAVPSIADLLQQRDRMIAEGIVQKIPVRSSQDFQARIAGLRQQEQTLNGINLKNISLSALGTQIEWTLHNSLHESFARPAAEILLLGGNNPWSSKTFFAETMPWNQFTYQHLGDPYAAATNPLFWLIHAYVDQWVNRWAQANNVVVDDDCGGKTRCYQWLQSTGGKPWDGGMGVDHAHELRVSAMPPELVRNLVNMGTFVTR